MGQQTERERKKERNEKGFAKIKVSRGIENNNDNKKYGFFHYL